MSRLREIPAHVEGVMTSSVVTVERGASVREAAETMARRRIGCIIVTEKDKPVGIVTERDILEKVVARGLDSSTTKMGEIMSHPLIAVKPDESIIKAARTMRKENIRRLIVLDNERLVGVVTERDLLRAAAFHVAISFRPLLRR